MSLDYIVVSWKARLSDPNAKLILMSLSDQANDDGICWPSIKHICLRTELSERSVQEKLSILIKKKLITRHERPGRSSVFELHYEQIESIGYHIKRGAGGAPLPPQVAHPTPAGGAPITVIESPLVTIDAGKAPASSDEAKPCIGYCDPDDQDTVALKQRKPRVGSNPRYFTGANGSRLSPNTSGSQLLFARLKENMKARGYRGPRQWATIELRDKFIEQEIRLGKNLEIAINTALEQGITTIPGIVNYVAKYGTDKKQKQNAEAVAAHNQAATKAAIQRAMEDNLGRGK